MTQVKKNIGHGFVFVYGGMDKYGRQWNRYKVIAKTPKEIFDAVGEWHSMGSETRPKLEVNENFKNKIEKLFEVGEFDNIYVGHDFATKNCGSFRIRAYVALADTIEEHDKIYHEQRDAERKEREQRYLAEQHEQKKGWYHVDADITVMNAQGRDRYKTFSGDIIATCLADAEQKAIGQMPDYCREQGYVYHSTDHIQSYFLGIKTDLGYSIEAWEEAKMNGEI